MVLKGKASKWLLSSEVVVVVVDGVLLLLLVLIRPKAREAAVLYALPLHLPHYA